MIYAQFLAAALAGLLIGVNGGKVMNLESYSFDNFVKEFRFKWSGEELMKRKAIFEEELARVRAHNAGHSTFKLGINKYSAMTKSEKQALLGHNKLSAKSHVPKHLLPNNIQMKPLSDLPDSVDWRTNPNTVTAVKDQGHCGSCWAFASAATLESHVALATGLLYELSPQQIAMCSPNPNNCGGTGGCNGATAEIAFDYLAGSGVVQEFEIGYNAYYGANSACAFSEETLPVANIKGYTRLAENNYTELMNAIAQVGPIAVSVDASTWHSYSSGVFNGCNQESPVINHAVTLVGYGTEDGQDYWLVRNSWSPSWGEGGYIKVLRTNNEEENCGMDTEPQSGTACEGDNTPVKVCGTCGILYDSSYPIGAALV